MGVKKQKSPARSLKNQLNEGREETIRFRIGSGRNEGVDLGDGLIERNPLSLPDRT